jgi:hypothetical protein
MLIKIMAIHEALTNKKKEFNLKKDATLLSQIHLSLGQNVMNDS